MRAFARLMSWVREHDSTEHTVIMVQVENETGMIPEPRDHWEESERAYESSVPENLLTLLTKGELGPEIAARWEKAGSKNEGTWKNVFGPDAEGEEVFTAWQVSNYVEKVAAAGKHGYPLQMFANAALIRPGYRPNQYPSGGPLPHLMEVWHAGSLVARHDLSRYLLLEFHGVVRTLRPERQSAFHSRDGPIDPPAANSVYAIAHDRAIGCGPFAIENVSAEKAKLIGSCYGNLAAMSELILKSQQDGKILGLSPQMEFNWSSDAKPQRGELAGVTFEAAIRSARRGGGS